MKRAEGLVFWPDKFLAQTEHLSDDEVGIYTKMLWRIWLFTPTQYSFEDTDANWSELMGLQSSGRMEKLRERFMNDVHPLFMRSHNRHGKFIVQKGLRASIQKIRKKSEQNSANARKRWALKNYKDANARETAMRSQCERNANSNSNSSLKDSVCLINNTSLKDKDSKKEKDTLRAGVWQNGEANLSEETKKKLEKMLSEKQIIQVQRVCEISEEYVKEKLALTKERRVRKPAAFLYAALTQDYHQVEPEESKRVEEDGKSFQERMAGRALNEKEFEELSEERRKLFTRSEHMRAERPGYRLKSKPEKYDGAMSRAFFETIELGGRIDESKFKGLFPAWREHFEKITLPPEPVVIYRLQK